jgi:hypothetical protein
VGVWNAALLESFRFSVVALFSRLGFSEAFGILPCFSSWVTNCLEPG